VANAAIFQGNSAGTDPGVVTIASEISSPSSGALISALDFADNGHVRAARIECIRDGGTWTTGSSQPSAVKFSTTASGASSPTERLRIDSSGKVGIGTSSSWAPLAVAKNGTTGPAGITGTATVSYFSNTAQNRGFAINYDDTNVTAGIYPLGVNSKLCFYTPSSSTYAERMRIDNQGRVGIGTTSPTQKLHVAGNALLKANNSYIGLQNASGTSTGYIQGQSNFLVIAGGSGSSNTIAFYPAITEAMRIDSSNRLLVGTSTSTAGTSSQYAKFQVIGNNSASANRGALVNLGHSAASASVTTNELIGQIMFTDNAAGEYGYIGCYADGTAGSGDYPGRLVFSTTADGASSATERMRIGSDGNLSVFGQTNNVLARVSGSGTSGWIYWGAYGATSATDGTQSFGVYANGNVVNTNNSYGAISDLKLKENIVDANSQWSDLKAFQVRNYNFKEGQTHTQIGLVAQEVELVSPGLVSESPDRDEDGNDLGTVTKSVNYSVLYMKAVKALQEAMERIETLEAKVAALEAE
jgi:hypothetical protein